jgi:hypothetical protein
MSISNETFNHFIRDLNPADVVLGRGAGPNDHSGNIAFRELVQELKPSYTATVNRKMKRHIAGKIVQAVKARRGRFLKRAPGHDDDVFVLAEEEVVLEKAKQALRHGRCTVKSRNKAGRVSSVSSLLSSPVTSTSKTLSTCSDMDQVATVTPVGSRIALTERPCSVHASPAAAASPTLPNDLLTLALLVQQRKMNATSGSATTPPPKMIPNAAILPPAPQIESRPEDKYNKNYQVLLQLLMALAEEKSHQSSTECLELLGLIETLIAAKRAKESAQNTLVAPDLSQKPSPLSINLIVQLLLSQQQQQNEMQNFQVSVPSQAPVVVPDTKSTQTASMTGLNPRLLDSAILEGFLPHLQHS